MTKTENNFDYLTDIELVDSERQIAERRIDQAVKKVKKSYELQEFLFKKVSGTVAVAKELFANKVKIFKPALAVENQHDIDTVRGMIEGNQLEGLHQLNANEILAKNDALTADETARLNDEYSFEPTDDATDEELDADKIREQISQIEDLDSDNLNLEV